jgi:hypothetical protein
MRVRVHALACQGVPTLQISVAGRLCLFMKSVKANRDSLRARTDVDLDAFDDIDVPVEYASAAPRSSALALQPMVTRSAGGGV